MRHRNFTIDEATELNRLVTELLPKIQAMPFGKRLIIKSLAVEQVPLQSMYAVFHRQRK